MIVLDTNVISEFARSKPSEFVVAWLTRQSADDLCTTAISEAELLIGLIMLPEGRRKSELVRSTQGMLAMLEPRIFPFDRDAAQLLPSIVMQRHAFRLETDQADGQIAAIARARGASIATRNVGDFEHAGVQIINPWTA